MGLIMPAGGGWGTPGAGATIGLISACCVSLWRLRSTLRWNARPQTSQANGLKPVCLRECVMRFEDWLKALPHTAHL